MDGCSPDKQCGNNAQMCDAKFKDLKRRSDGGERRRDDGRRKDGRRPDAHRRQLERRHRHEVGVKLGPEINNFLGIFPCK